MFGPARLRATILGGRLVLRDNISQSKNFPTTKFRSFLFPGTAPGRSSLGPTRRPPPAARQAKRATTAQSIKKDAIQHLLLFLQVYQVQRYLLQLVYIELAFYH